MERRLASLLPWLLLALGLALTGFLHRQLTARDALVAEAKFALRAEEIATRVEHLMTANAQVLRGIAGLFAATHDLNRAEFHAYVESLRLTAHYPGIQAIGYAALVPAAEGAAYETAVRAEGLTDDQIRPAGVRDPASAVVYIEPLDWRNRRALGFDLLTEPVRAAAAARARDEDRVVLSEPLTLKQESATDVQPGVLIFLPIYAPGQPVATVAERRAALRGWTYAALRVRDALDANLLAGDGALARQFALRIEARGATPADPPLYTLNTSPAPVQDLAVTRHIAFGGTEWTLHAAPLTGYLATERALATGTVLIAGLLLSLALALTTAILIRGHLRLATALGEAGRANRALAERTSELAASEGRVRAKLDALLAPEGDFGTLDLSDIVDAPAVQAIMDEFYRLTRIGMGLIDLNGRVLVATGWQRICTQFHRVHPDTARNCLESDSLLSRGVSAGTYRAYRCKNGMWDLVTPVVLDDRHIGNLFLGQFFFDDEAPDREAFRAQARRFGFDETAYLAALDEVPRWDREKVDAVMHFYMRFAGLISRLSHANILLARALAEQQCVDAALRATKDQAEAASRAKSAFLANMSHEIRTPLNAILGFAQVLARDPGIDDDRRAHLASIRRNGEHLLVLISDILDMAKIEAGRMTLRVTRFDLPQLLADTLAYFQTPATARGLTLTLETGALPRQASADRLRLQQVLMNLIGNALKFTDSGGVTLRAEPVDGGLRFTVQDTGIGIAAEDATRIFEPFTQAAAGSRVLEGTGLGLALCDQYVQLMGGALALESTPGQGSRFSFVLPLPMGEPASAPGTGDPDANLVPVPEADQGPVGDARAKTAATGLPSADGGSPPVAPALSHAEAAARLAACPADWQAALAAAVNLGDFVHIGDLLAPLRETDPLLHALLARWAYDFALEPFNALLRAAAAAASTECHEPEQQN